LQGCGISRNDLSFALVGDIAEYAAANQLHLPNDWRSFVSWHTETHKKNRWREPDLVTLFSLEWGANISYMASNHIDAIHVIDPDLQHLERALNETFRRYVAGLITTTDNASQP
jgi:hypothetical protein